ncbi:MAG: GLPGLI family protein [Flavobacterium sp.]|nr:GLPGLI family protein [Flavobacterium sp.]
MKNLFKVIYLTIILTTVNLTVAQNFKGKAIYQSKIKSEETVGEIKSEKDAEFDKAFQKEWEKVSQKTYSLSFNKTESLFEEEQKLEPVGQSDSGMTISITISGDGKKYMNRKVQKQIFEGEIFEKKYLITDELTNWDWQLKEETKIIGDYLCYKAEIVIQVTAAQKEEYQDYLKNKFKQKTNLFEMDEPKNNIVTAWYTLEIPVNHGPDKYSGLPGLILELNDGEVTFLCSKVVLNSEDKVKIKAPNEGKVLTQKEFDKEEKKKMDSMKDKDGNVIFRTSN